MIRRLYVDNYKSLVDFTWEPKRENLVLGVNGSGKTAALDAIDIVRTWCCDWTKDERWLSRDSLSRFQSKNAAEFQLDVEVDGALYSYEVAFDLNDRQGSSEVRSETLRKGKATLFRRNFKAVDFRSSTGDVQHFPLPVNLSAVHAILSLDHSEEVSKFEAALEAMVIVRPFPNAMSDEAKAPERRPSSRFENFAAWYYLQSGSGLFPTATFELLRQVWEDFDHLRLEQLGRAAILSAVFKKDGSASAQVSLGFNDLSDGERMLIVLYSLAAYQRTNEPTTLIVDEPDNFLALAELQPWLLQILNDRPTAGQIIVVSHNAEIVNTMGEHRVSLFSRQDHVSPTTVSGLKTSEDGLPLSELLTRGWVVPDDSEAAMQGNRG